MHPNITKDSSGNDLHRGELFPGADVRQFAYQDECLSAGITISAYNPSCMVDKLNHDLPESLYSRYELTIERHTQTSFAVKLIAHRKDIVEQRMAQGCAVMSDVFLTGLSFGQLCNRLFGPGAQVFHETEHFPESVRPAMAAAYRGEF